MLRKLFRIVFGLPLAFLAWHTLVRIIRHFHKFPIPQFLANAIDNPLRRRIQPPAEMPLRHSIAPGMTVLDVGPGNGRYTVEAARRVGESGRVIAIDIEPRMLERVSRRAQAEGIANLEARLADVYALPFSDGALDAVCLMSVIGELPDPDRAIREFKRVLKPGGTLAFSELLMDPDYPLAQTLVRKAQAAGLHLKTRSGNFFSYTLVFENA
jgi:ubiquinone/menaquinone biosynthesis C-methylase UbiE